MLNIISHQENNGDLNHNEVLLLLSKWLKLKKKKIVATPNAGKDVEAKLLMHLA